ncbi:MAG: hypothetical protein VKM92_08265 [Cyanobacteriota bacterium]|nr:hypothetical protein [Cyanobacteriota bacterium]
MAKPITTPELLADAAADAQDPEHCDRRRCWASRSQLARPHQLERLQAETEVLWLDPAGLELEWLRESFMGRRPRGPHVRAITVDAAGRIVRAFCASDRDLAAYRRLRASGHGSCPIEAVWPASIKPGEPALPAHAWLAAAEAA